MRSFLLFVTGGVALLLCVACGKSSPDAGPTGPSPIQGACGFSVSQSQTTQTVDVNGGDLTIAVTVTDPACAWTAASNDSFVSVVDGASGRGNGTVRLRIAANHVGARNATVTIAGVTFTVSQPAAPCQLAVGGELTRSIGSAGGEVVITVTATQGANCPWTVASNATFIMLTSGGSRADNGTVTFNVAPNTGPARSGTISVAGQTVTINQASGLTPPTGCMFAVDPISIPFDRAGGKATLIVMDEGAGCSWTVSSQSPFITVGAITHTSETRSEVVLDVAPNFGNARTGAVTVENPRLTLTVTINQSGGPCTFAVVPARIDVSAAGGSSTLVVTDEGLGCSWTASSDSSFITVDTVYTSDTRAEVNVSVAPNTGSSRSGAVVVANPRMTVHVTVSQSGP